MDMECGPLDRSLLTLQDRHISSLIWEGGDRNTLDVRQLTARMGEWHILPDQQALLDAYGFGAFGNPRVVRQNDIRLITALIERWRPETNTFHLPCGEMTITLEDVYMILGLPVTGRPLTHSELERPKEWFMKNWEDPYMSEQERREFYKDGLHFKQLRNRYGARADTRDMDAAQIEVQCRVHTRAYMLFIIGGVLFPSSSRDTVHPRYMQLLMEDSEIRGYAWGAAVLAHLYRSLTLSADRSVRTFNGCSLLLMLWAYERLAPGRPEIAPHQEIRWPRARAWAEPVKVSRVNPHHHTRNYRGDLDSLQLHWVTWQPYARLYEREADPDDVDATHFPVCRHMALGRIPMVAFEIIEYQYSDRVLRQFGMCQHIPDDPFDHAVLRLERQSSFQRPHRLAMYQQYVAEWESYVATGGPEIVKGGFVSLAEYMQWYRRVSKMRIARCVPPEGDIIQPRDWYPQQMMGDAVWCSLLVSNCSLYLFPITTSYKMD